MGCLIRCYKRRLVAKPSRRFLQATRCIHTNLRDVVPAGVVARVESLPPSFHFGVRQRGRMAESERQVEGLFESLLAEAFG